METCRESNEIRFHIHITASFYTQFKRLFEATILSRFLVCIAGAVHAALARSDDQILFRGSRYEKLLFHDAFLQKHPTTIIALFSTTRHFRLRG
jgi:hypothetical protein